MVQGKQENLNSEKIRLLLEKRETKYLQGKAYKDALSSMDRKERLAYNKCMRDTWGDNKSTAWEESSKINKDTWNKMYPEKLVEDTPLAVVEEATMQHPPKNKRKCKSEGDQLQVGRKNSNFAIYTPQQNPKYPEMRKLNL